MNYICFRIIGGKMTLAGYNRRECDVFSFESQNRCMKDSWIGSLGRKEYSGILRRFE